MKLGLLAFLFFTIYAASILACRHHDEDSSSVGSDEHNCRHHHHHHHHHRGHRHHNCEEADESESGSTDKCKCRHSHHDDSEASKEDKTYESNDDEGSAEDEQSTEEEDVDDITDAQETEKTEEVETEEVVSEETEEVVSEETEDVVSKKTEEVVSEETEEVVSEETEEVVSEETEEEVTAEPEEVVTEEPEGEGCPIELVFVVDTSERVGESYLAKIKSVINFVVDSTHVGRGSKQSHVGIVSTSSAKNSILDLNEPTDVQSLKSVINNLEFTTTDTNLERAINVAATQFTFARHGLPRFLVAITDGNDGSDFKEINKTANSLNIKLLAVGLGTEFSYQNLFTAADRDLNGVYVPIFQDPMDYLRRRINRCNTGRGFTEDDRFKSNDLFVY